MNSILIVIDMQNDFVDGALGTGEAQQIVPGVAARIRSARAAGWGVIATMDTHDEGYLETREGQNLPVPHCIRGTAGWQINAEVAEALGDAPRLEKPAFGSLELPELVRTLCGQPDRIELCGLCTDICVVSNAMILKAAFPEADMTVRSDLCAGVTPEKHRAALETMCSCQIEIGGQE